MADWRIYTGTADLHPVELPPAPPWRQFGNPGSGDGPELPAPEDDSEAALKFRATPDMVDAVNAALVLRRPLLLTGRPGSGKSSLIESVARELQLGRVLRWHVTSASTLVDALYRYDAIGRLHAHGLRRERGEDKPPARQDVPRSRAGAAVAATGEAPEIEDYLRLGPLGTALLPLPRPRALLIDEIDRATSTSRTTCSTSSSAASSRFQNSHGWAAGRSTYGWTAATKPTPSTTATCAARSSHSWCSLATASAIFPPRSCAGASGCACPTRQ